jgi:tetratricopeptide (TPR) repeat protein
LFRRVGQRTRADDFGYSRHVLFLGRQLELQSLVQGCDAAVAGQGGVHLVVGEPGIGQTRLAQEVATVAESKGLLVAWGRAWETGGAPPFYPWIEALEALGGSGAGAPGLNESRPTRGESASLDSAHERFAIFEQVARFFRERSRTTPLLLVLDDLHAADLPSLELLHFIARGVRARHLAIIGTLRDAESRRAPVAEALARVAREAVTLTLALLGPENVARLVEEQTGRVDATLTAEVIAKTEGNPLFVSEALRTMVQGRPIAPSSILALVASRTHGLDHEASQFLDAASVFGRRILVVPLAHATGTPVVEVVQKLGDLAARGVLRASDEGAYVFSHALVRDAFYDRIAPDRRRELHRNIATALTRDGERHAALAAHHLLAAVPLVTAQALVQATTVAAEVARTRLAPEDAVTLLEKATVAVEDLAPSEAERIELLLALGWAATEAGALARGRQVFREASRRAATTGDATLIARAALGQGAELVFGEVRDELVATLRSALAGLPDSLDLRARLLARLAAALQPSTTPEEPVALATRAMAMAKEVANPRVRAEIALAAGAALTDFAPPVERVPVSEELVRVARSLDDAILELRGLTRLATDWLEMGDFARAEGVIEARAELAAGIGHPRYLWQTPLLRSMLAMPKGDFARCDESIEEATAIGQEGLDVNAAHVIAMHQFWLLLVRGDTKGLLAHEPEILRAMCRMPEPAQHHAMVHAVLYARAGEPERAREALVGIADGLRLLAPMMQVTIADAALLAEDAARFADLLARLSPARGRNTVWGPFGFVCGPPYGATLGSLEARLGKREQALASFAAALALARRSGATASEAWVHLARAEALQRWSLPAADDFATAAGLAQKLGMPAILQRAQGAGVASKALGRPAAASKPAPTTELAFSFRSLGNEVVLTCNGRTTRLRLVRGLPMLAQLVEHPGRELHVLDLAADSDEEGAVIDRGDAGEVLDAKARAAYQRRLVDLRSEIDDADRLGDASSADGARRELDLLVQQLSSAIGLGGRARRVGAAAERARTVVQRRIREAIKKVAEQEPELGQHLDWAIRTGTFCAYEPLGRKTAI